ncbi:hypothetical protein JHK87_018129 [Glycine soja]|nr:hypothetical protein JHK87_018129 [Glycine soja]
MVKGDSIPMASLGAFQNKIVADISNLPQQPKSLIQVGRRYTFQRQSLGLKAKKLEKQKIPWSWLKSKMIFHIYKKIWPMKIGPTSLGSKVHDEAKEATQSSTPTNIEQVHVKKNIDKKRQSMRRQTNRFRPGDFQDLLLMVPRVIGDPENNTLLQSDALHDPRMLSSNPQ